ncbi:hypothetical protein D9M71_351810 [compost metagenome]
MVVAELDAPDRFFRVVDGLAIAERIAIAAGPDGVPVVELVGRARLKRLVVDRQLNPVGRAEHVGFTTPIHRGVAVELDALDATDLAYPIRPAVHAVDDILGRRPALHIQGDMDGTLVRFAVGQYSRGEVIEHALECLRRCAVDGMRRHFDLEVRTDGVEFDVVVLDQQDHAEVRVLQPELVAGVATDAPLRPLMAGELDDGVRHIEQRHHLGPQHAVVQLPHRIHAATQHAHTRKVGEVSGGPIDEQPPARRIDDLAIGLQDQAVEMIKFCHWLHPSISNYGPCGQSLSDVLQGRPPRSRQGARALRYLPGARRAPSKQAHAR